MTQHHRFIATGLLCTVLHWGVAQLGLSFGLGVLPANSLGYAVGGIASYAIQASWTFGSRFSSRSAARFCLVASAGALLAGLIARAVSMVWDNSTGQTIVAAGTVAVVSFVLHKAWTFASTELEAE